MKQLTTRMILAAAQLTGKEMKERLKFSLTLAVVAFGLMLGAAQSAQAQQTGVIPVLHSASYDSTTGKLTAFFGYINTTSMPVTFKTGTISNFFSPPPGTRGQGATFLPGVHPVAFGAVFDPGSTPQITWTIDTKQAAVTLGDKSPFQSGVQFSSDTYLVTPGTGSVTVTVTRTHGRGAMSVDYSTADGTATAGPDYTAVTGTVNFAEGEVTKSFNVPILAQASGKTALLRLSNPTGAFSLRGLTTEGRDNPKMSVALLTIGSLFNPDLIQTQAPSNIFVSGLSGVVTEVRVGLYNFFRSNVIDETDILLVGPSGQKMLLMSDAGGGTFGGTLVFDDAATSRLPNGSAITPGTYKPTNYDPPDNDDSFTFQPPPYQLSAPAGTATLASVFNGANPNGVWSLYVRSPGDVPIVDGWSLEIQTSSNCPTISLSPAALPSAISGTAYNVALTATGGTGSYNFSLTDGVLPGGLALSNGVLSGTLSASGTFNFTLTASDGNSCSGSQAYSLTLTCPTITFSASQVNPTCNGAANGSLTISNVLGGTEPYQYSINNGAQFFANPSFTGLGAGTYQVVVKDANNCTSTSSVTITQPPAISLSTVVTNVNCFGGTTGSMNLTVSGGTTPYTFLWSDGATTEDRSGRVAGTYSVTVTDANGCMTSKSVTITQPAALGSTETHTNLSCLGSTNGSIDLSVSGGSTPYTFRWSDGVTTEDRSGLAAGNYSVTVTDANGCTTSRSVMIAQPAVVIFSTLPVNPTCNGATNGSLSISNVLGGTGTYQFSINNGASFFANPSFTGLGAGTYQVVVKDANGCQSAVASVTLTQPSAVTFSTSQVNPTCNGATNGSLTINATGGAGTLQYSINNGQSFQPANMFTGLAAGVYNLVIKDSGNCLVTATATLTQPSALNFTATPVNPTCNGATNGQLTINASGGTGALLYSINNGQSFSSNNQFTGLAAGAYQVVVKDSNNCAAAAQSVLLSNPAVLSFTTQTSTPTCTGASNGQLTINATGGTGVLLYSINNGTSFQAANVFNGLTAGSYQVVVKDANNCTTAAQGVSLTQPQTLSFSTSKTDPTCNGASNGSLSVNASGGTGALLYSINNGAGFQPSPSFNNLPAGTYQVVVKDANACQTAAIAVTLAQPAASTATLSGAGAIRPGQSASLTVTLAGGTPPYTVTLNNGGGTQTGASPLQFSLSPAVTTTYAISSAVDNNGCPATPQGSATIIVDSTPPTITCPPAQVGVIAGSSGAVTYPVPTVTDNNPGATFNCTPLSGAPFALGTTTVNCTATDVAGLTASCSFTVVVRTPRAAVTNLKTQVQALVPTTLTQSQANSLISYLELAGTHLEQGNNSATCTDLASFNTQCNNPSLPMNTTQRDNLISYANKIRAAIGCGGAFSPQTVGLYNSRNSEFQLKQQNVTGLAERIERYGQPGAWPVAGDWDGDGLDTIGVFQQGVFYLHGAGKAEEELVVEFGQAGDVPVVGDWDGDGVDTVGVYREGHFLLRNSNQSGPPDLIVQLGSVGDLPLAGDWDGDGQVTVGVYNPATGMFRLSNSLKLGLADIEVQWGGPDYWPVVGDWDGDGVTTLGLYSERGEFLLRNTNTTGPPELSFTLGVRGGLPVAGAWSKSP